MGIQDRDWYRDVLNERDKKEQRIFPFTKNRGRSRAKGQLSLFWMMFIWLIILVSLYLVARHYLKPKPVLISANGEMVIARHRDGHFYATGTVAGKPVNFLIDTGASMITVSEQFAREAGISTGIGVPTLFKTANGDLPGRILSDMTVSMGPIDVSGVKVAVGLVGHEVSDALLGQNFLSKFDVTLQKDQMILRQR